MLWVASKALAMSPFSKEFGLLSEAQITWAIINYYKDQDEDLEKYKLICRFTNPEAARKLFDQKPDNVEIPEEFLDEIMKHTKSNIDRNTLRTSIGNPENNLSESTVYNIDTIEKVDS